MKTETNSMRIVKPEKTDTAGTNQQGKAPGKTKYKPVTPVMLCLLYTSPSPRDS